MYQFGQCNGCSKFILAIILLDFSFFSSNIARLCTKDPISVSQQFSYKFHDFFNTVIMKWVVLGTVDHYYWKEYQMRGAPHYHIVLRKRDSPVLDRDSPKKVLSFIQERTFLTIKHLPTCMFWSQNTKCTSAMHIAREILNLTKHV